MNQKEKVINQVLIDNIKEKIKDSPVDTLMKILPLGKEAMYRRLRGDVLFTFSEAALIAQKLHISLDNVAFISSDSHELAKNEEPILQFDLNRYNKELEKWVGMLEHYLNTSNPTVYLTIVDFGMPLLTDISDLLLKYVYFQTVFDNGGLDEKTMQFSDFEIPKSLLDRLKMGFKTLHSFDICCILDSYTIVSNIKKLKYLNELGVINEEEYKNILCDFYGSLTKLRDRCNTGCTPQGKKFTLYISEINVGASFSIFENDRESTLFIRLMGINFNYFSNSSSVRVYKHVFENLLNHSNLISGSGAVQRAIFFKKQFALFDKE